ncbi:MAG: type II toxin-antitoxin system RelE/ParE family toxin [Alphaproteobacteria bacterium]|nr:type II toxin-antitoxin system RelE/ParE family toxin [Alphaproteobacteria bacterium]
MITSFRSKELEKFWPTGDGAKIRQDQLPRIRRRLDALDAAHRAEDLNLPGFNFHSLRGKPQRYAISVNGPWRITFGWDGDNATQVDLEQYH